MRIIRALIVTLFSILFACPAMALDVTVKVSSFKVDFGLPHAPENLLDGNPRTAWVGGGISGGKGQWMELAFDVPIRVERLGIFNGHQGEGEFEKYRRIRSGRIVYPDGTQTQFWLRDEPGEQVIVCAGEPHKSLRIVVEEVFPKGEDPTSKMKLAVSELKLYLSLMANPNEVLNPDKVGPPKAMAKPPVDPDKVVPPQIEELLREFYVRHTTLSEEFAELFAEDVRDRNDFRFEVFKQVQRQQGTYDAFKSAKVDPAGLGFELIEREGDFARIRVFGAYRVQVKHLDRNLEEDSVFVVSKEQGGWKIIELEGEEPLF